MTDTTNEHRKAPGSRAAEMSMDRRSGNRLVDALKDRVKAELQSGERVTWIGRPGASSVARSYAPAFFGGLFLVLWSSGVFVGTTIGIVDPSLDIDRPHGIVQWFGFFLLWSFVLLLFVSGVIGVLSPLYAWIRAIETVHVVTDRRLMTVSLWPGLAVSTLAPAYFGCVERKARRQGCGDLTFHLAVKSRDGNDCTLMNSWLGIPDPVGAQAAIERLMANPPPA